MDERMMLDVLRTIAANESEHADVRVKAAETVLALAATDPIGEAGEKVREAIARARAAHDESVRLGELGAAARLAREDAYAALDVAREELRRCVEDE